MNILGQKLSLYEASAWFDDAVGIIKEVADWIDLGAFAGEDENNIPAFFDHLMCFRDDILELEK